MCKNPMRHANATCRIFNTSSSPNWYTILTQSINRVGFTIYPPLNDSSQIFFGSNPGPTSVQAGGVIAGGTPIKHTINDSGDLVTQQVCYCNLTLNTSITIVEYTRGICDGSCE